tara:strand:+ start:46189 stop:46461 length:273 start_codon:yes stop_codon:yes gene_type:complete
MDAILVLTDQQPDQTQTLFGFPVTGFVAAIVGYGYPVTGNAAQQTLVSTVHVVGNDINLAFGEFISPRVSLFVWDCGGIGRHKRLKISRP